MPQLNIRGVPIQFPYEPYELQKNYMEKVVECLQNEQNGILESPTGTGKTLSLLCSSLAWLQLKKAQVEAQCLTGNNDNFLDKLSNELDHLAGKCGFGRALSGIPKIIYASRTHTQISQAMQELKKTAYKDMKACVLGSREQMCINPEVMKETNNYIKTQMCLLKTKTRTCHFHGKVDRMKDDPSVKDVPIMDIEDLCKLGNLKKFCPYFMSKELIKQADIIFMPYNYVLDFRMRKTLGINLTDHILILDEAHNVEKMCEDSISLQLKSSEIAIAIDEITAVMKIISDENSFAFDEAPKDFSNEDLCELKQLLLDFEKVVDDECKNDVTYEGTFMLDLFEKVNVKPNNVDKLLQLINCIVQYLTTLNSDGPFARKGVGLQHLEEVLSIIFIERNDEFKTKVKQCCKVHVGKEVNKKDFKKRDNFLTKMTSTGDNGKILNYWCFSPGFGMKLVLSQGLRSLILTSGTLAPLKPLITELEIDVKVYLENPHIVKGDQVCVKIVTEGPDMQPLNCNFHNRENPKYLNSLGRTIANLIKVTPGGVLIFFSSYPQMQNTQQHWQFTGLWSEISSNKPIFIEPRTKESFNAVMKEYYEKINEPKSKGAIFMGVCRGKVSEGLDFADVNGRAVIIIGIPFPPFKDPRVELKRKYLDQRNAKNNEFLKGSAWYSLEATRAVNQAIGRVIRHKNDYGAILLLDERYKYEQYRSQISKWLKEHISISAPENGSNFGKLMRELRIFYQKAETNHPLLERTLEMAESAHVQAEFKDLNVYEKNAKLMEESSSSSSSCYCDDAMMKQQKNNYVLNPRKKLKLITQTSEVRNEEMNKEITAKDYILMLQKKLDTDRFKMFLNALECYKKSSDFKELSSNLDKIFNTRPSNPLLWGLETYLKENHKSMFQEYLSLRS